MCSSQRFARACCLDPQNRFQGVKIFLDYNGHGGDKILQMLIILCPSTRRHNPEDSKLHQHHCQNFSVIIS